MTTFAQLDSNDLFTGKTANYDGNPPTKAELSPGKPYWVPLRRFTTDNSTTEFKIGEKQPPVVDLGVPEVYIETIVRDKTAQEITDEGTDIRQKMLVNDKPMVAFMRVVAKIAASEYGVTEAQARTRLFDEFLTEYENL